jgi:amino acid transporter
MDRSALTKGPQDHSAAPTLRRSIGSMQMAMYGLGSMIGSGIYGLLGQAAAQVGNAVWLAFLIALAAALLTTLSYASLGSRYPRAGGAAFLAERAYRWPLLSFVVGLAVVCAGITSVATQSRVFAANIAPLLGSSGSVTPWVALGFLLLLAGIVFRGIRESIWVNVGCTLIEAAGLLIVIAMGLRFWGDVDYTEIPATAPDQNLWLAVLNGAVLTFFAFIEFEDTVNVAEECRNPQRTVPLGLILAMSLAATLYIAVSITAVSVVPWPHLAAAASPLTEVIARRPRISADRLYADCRIRGREHGAGQLCNRLSHDLRHGGAEPAAEELGHGASEDTHTPYCLNSSHAPQLTPHL